MISVGVTLYQLDMLANLEWLEQMFNLILIGPPGTGKIHIALAVGNKAVRAGYNVAFTTMDALMHVLKTAEIAKNSAARLRWFKKCDLLIIDELGYLPVSKIVSYILENETNLINESIKRIHIENSIKLRQLAWELILLKNALSKFDLRASTLLKDVFGYSIKA